jgi:hypothetical protein
MIEWVQRGGTYLFPGVNPWERFAQSVIVIWCMLMLPLFVALEAALLAGLEHTDHQWKHMFALPIPRWIILAAKAFVSVLLIGCSSLVLWLAILAAGFVLQQVNPQLGFADQPIPWAGIFGKTVLVYFASWLILAIHLWISIRWRSFTLAMGIGIACTFLGLIFSSSVLGWIYPWSLPVNIVFGQGERVMSAVVLGIVGGAVVTVLTNLHISRQDIL